MIMKIKCVQINILGFIAHFNDRLPPLTGYYASRFGVKENGLLIGAYAEDEPCGALIAERSGDSLLILYAAVSEKHRRKGGFTALLNECKKHGKRIRLKYTPEPPENDYLDSFLQRAGWQKHLSLITTVIPLSRDNIKAEWFAFATGKGGRMLEKLKKRGYTAVSYNEAAPEVLENLYAQMGVNFPAYLDPRKVPNPMLKRHSYITVRDNQTVAYCIMTSADEGKTAILEHMAASKELHGRGAFLPCFIAAVSSLFAEGVCKLSYAYSVNNERLPKIATDMSWFSGKTVKQLYEYTLIKE